MFSKWLSGKCDAEEIEKQRRKSMAYELALRSVEERRKDILTQNKDAIINIYSYDREVVLTAYDASGQQAIAREKHSF